MTEADLTFLKSHLEQPVVIETIHGERFIAYVLFLFDEGDTPDLFCLQLELGPNNTYVQKSPDGLSMLLADITAAHAAPIPPESSGPS